MNAIKSLCLAAALVGASTAAVAMPTFFLMPGEGSSYRDQLVQEMHVDCGRSELSLAEQFECQTEIQALVADNPAARTGKYFARILTPSERNALVSTAEYRKLEERCEGLGLAEDARHDCLDEAEYVVFDQLGRVPCAGKSGESACRVAVRKYFPD